jgi:hypothetical protein
MKYGVVLVKDISVVVDVMTDLRDRHLRGGLKYTRSIIFIIPKKGSYGHGSLRLYSQINEEVTNEILRGCRELTRSFW